MADIKTINVAGTSYNIVDAGAARSTHTHSYAPTTAITEISRSGTTFTATRADGTTFTFTQQDNNTTYTPASAAPAVIPNSTASVTGTSTNYARQDHTHGLSKAAVTTALGYTPPATNTTYGVVSKTANGLAPQLPNETTTTKYLRQDGTWQVPPDTNTNTTYSAGTGMTLSSTTFHGPVHVGATTTTPATNALI